MEKDIYRERNQTHIGTLGWVGLAAGVVAFDLISEETLSHAFQRGTENSRSRPLVLGAMAVTSAHLLGILPDRVDPFRLLER